MKRYNAQVTKVTIVCYNHERRSKLWYHPLTTLEVSFMIAMIFLVQAIAF